MVYSFDETLGLKKLIGAKVYDVTLDEARQVITFQTNRGDYVYEAEGDCCSYSYFEEVQGVEKLRENGAVISVRMLEIEPNDLVPVYQDEVKWYGFELVTENPKWGAQTTVVAFRNESNGYYGGTLRFRGEPYIEGSLAGPAIEQ